MKPKGNVMTQKYYYERLLPVYIQAIKDARNQDSENSQKWILQEDNDPSHGHKKKGLAHHLKELDSVKTLVHPAQSPDLNPAEGV